MTSRALLVASAGIAVGLTAIGALLHEKVLERSVIQGRLPHGPAAWQAIEATDGNICVAPNARARTAQTPTCASVDVYGAIFEAIGVTEQDEVLFQQGDTFNNRGVNTATGKLFAPGYPVFSRLAWSTFDGFCLQGPELPALSGEIQRATLQTHDAATQVELYRLSLLLEHAQVEAKVLCF